MYSWNGSQPPQQAQDAANEPPQTDLLSLLSQLSQPAAPAQPQYQQQHPTSAFNNALSTPMSSLLIEQVKLEYQRNAAAAAQQPPQQQAYQPFQQQPASSGYTQYPQQQPQSYSMFSGQQQQYQQPPSASAGGIISMLQQMLQQSQSQQPQSQVGYNPPPNGIGTPPQSSLLSMWMQSEKGADAGGSAVAALQPATTTAMYASSGGFSGSSEPKSSTPTSTDTIRADTDMGHVDFGPDEGHDTTAQPSSSPPKPRPRLEGRMSETGKPSPAVLHALAELSEDGKIFQLIKELQKSQTEKETQLLSKRLALTKKADNDLLAMDILGNIPAHEKRQRAQRLEEELVVFDRMIIREMDVLRRGQQGVLEEAGVPMYYVTEDPVQIGQQQKLLELLLNMAPE
ncbi:uncharacterized protein EV422DRAFT_502942 [Fimicolochytrium jonesii]|uniref:uncharacterized protein n=1 Tax=Fimicolochytrium jonesii TaxID=1396493 RepID=UPI0022FE383A|nr:uncharacterized protein EV422DRAFT_502942 [Fimicolochytrium jonesii]KAI8827263.1 hypothetical protein EV422DRAFT_502942 [Fimicolochytrium jonesii]